MTNEELPEGLELKIIYLDSSEVRHERKFVKSNFGESEELLKEIKEQGWTVVSAEMRIKQP